LGQGCPVFDSTGISVAKKIPPFDCAQGRRLRCFSGGSTQDAAMAHLRSEHITRILGVLA